MRSRVAVGILFVSLLASPTFGAGAERLPMAAAAPGWLGVELHDASDGVHVVHVVRSSPADKIGMVDGDRVSKVDALTVSAATDVTRIISAHAASDAIDIAIVHNGTPRVARAVLAPRPTSDEIARMEFVGTFAPSFSSLLAVSGALPNVQALRGRVIVLEFWATWCGPCRLSTPILSGWQARYGAQGLSVVGITTDPVDKASLYAQEAGARYSIASDPSGITTETYRVRSLPSLFVVDKRGVVRDVVIGFQNNTESLIEKEIAALLAEPSPANSP